jgi:plastocyanin
MRRTALLVLAVLVSFAACGDDDDGGSADGGTGDGATVEVVAKDIDFGEVFYEAPAGEVTFRYENQGNLVHTLRIEGVDGFKLEVSSRGATDEGTATLEAGEYVLFCDVPGHRDTGMEARLTVD